jgi:hypothetical protein
VVKKPGSLLFKGFLSGLGWSLGATFGFTILVTILSVILNFLGGMPFVGSILADLIHFTNEALKTKVTVSK